MVKGPFIQIERFAYTPPLKGRRREGKLRIVDGTQGEHEYILVNPSSRANELRGLRHKIASAAILSPDGPGHWELHIEREDGLPPILIGCTEIREISMDWSGRWAR